MGQLDILNTGHGHIELKFDADDVIETTRAKRIIADMLQRGYALFVHGEGDKLVRVKKFDETKGVYVVADGAEVATAVEHKGSVDEHSFVPGEYLPPLKHRGRKSKVASKEVHMGKVKATAVGRSAGG